MKNHFCPSIHSVMAACLASILLFAAQVYGEEYYFDSCCQTMTNESSCPIAEFKAGYFFFADSKMRKVYNKGGYDLQIAGSFPIWNCFQLYGSAEYLECCGRSLGDHQKTRIWEVPLSLGLKAIIPITCQLQYYITVGPRYFFVRQHNESQYVPKNIKRNGIGGFVGTGFNYEYCGFVLDIFGEYSYRRIHFSNAKINVTGHSVQVGGFVFGAGLGYAF